MLRYRDFGNNKEISWLVKVLLTQSAADLHSEVSAANLYSQALCLETAHTIAPSGFTSLVAVGCDRAYSKCFQQTPVFQSRESVNVSRMI